MKLAAAAWLAAAAAAQVRPVSPDELPETLREPGWLAAIEKDTARRLRDGEWDHLVHYALQSSRFTDLPPIEPAVSARQWKELDRVPPDAQRRLRAFTEAPAATARHGALRALLTADASIESEYERVMTFLYEKEWGGAKLAAQARRDRTARLYQTRGHSTDTAITASFGVHTGLAVIKDLAPDTSVHRVLLAGPGLDQAPRTGLNEDAPPQSWQPYALADSLIRLGLANANDLAIDCADINPRVTDHINAFAALPGRLTFTYPPGGAEWNSYFDRLGASAGKAGGNGPSRWFEPAPELAKRIRGVRMNILTQRAEPGGVYDLAVATNVLLYFNDRELGLAMANLAHALKPGGRLLHNELRGAVDQWGRALGIPPAHARTVRVDPRRELYDGVVLHVRERTE